MISSLLLASAALIELGVSPLVEPGHQHNWSKLHIDEDENSIFDSAWSQSFKQGQQEFRLILTRSEVVDEGDLIKMDVIIAVDCETNMLGAKSLHIFESPMGKGFDIEIDEVEMEAASDPLKGDEAAIISVACDVERSQ